MCCASATRKLRSRPLAWKPPHDCCWDVALWTIVCAHGCGSRVLAVRRHQVLLSALRCMVMWFPSSAPQLQMHTSQAETYDSYRVCCHWYSSCGKRLYAGALGNCCLSSKLSCTYTSPNQRSIFGTVCAVNILGDCTACIANQPPWPRC
jgi:hypothetical protein